MEIFLGILIPFIGTTLGAACVLFMKKALKKTGAVCTCRICSRGNGCSIHLESFDSGN